jgi:hypothetical protein
MRGMAKAMFSMILANSTNPSRPIIKPLKLIPNINGHGEAKGLPFMI